MTWKKPYKIIERDNGVLKIFGNCHNIELFEDIPEWEQDKKTDNPVYEPKYESCFMYRGRKYFLSEFMRIDKKLQDDLKEFDGIHNDSFFSGVLVKLNDCGDSIKAYTYVC